MTAGQKVRGFGSQHELLRCANFDRARRSRELSDDS
jgi:hypothetical protein